MRAAVFFVFLAAWIVSLAGCSSVESSGHVRYRKTLVESRAEGLERISVVGVGYANRDWDGSEPVPAGRGRVVLLRPKSPDDLGEGVIFRINDKGDFLLGAGCALAWDHPAGTLKIRFVSRFGVIAGEQRLRGMDPVMLQIPEGRTRYFLVRESRARTPLLSPVEGPDAERILASPAMKKSAVPRDIEGEIPWLP